MADIDRLMAIKDDTDYDSILRADFVASLIRVTVKAVAIIIGLASITVITDVIGTSSSEIPATFNNAIILLKIIPVLFIMALIAYLVYVKTK